MSTIIVDTAAELSAMLPDVVRTVVDPELLQEAPTAAALRVLATIRDDRWQPFVHPFAINWPALLDWARGTYRRHDSVLVRLEIAASLAGYPGAQVSLWYAARALDDSNYLGMLDALRIARDGVTS